MLTFAVDDIRDMLRVLEEHPEWRAELRRALLTDEFLQLPALVSALTEALSRLTDRVDALAQAQARTDRQISVLTERVDALAEAQARTDRQLSVLTDRVVALGEAQARTDRQLSVLTDRVDALTVAVGRVEDQVSLLASRQDKMRTELATANGTILELRYRNHAHAYFAPLAVGIRQIDGGTISQLVDEHVRSGQLRPGEAHEILWADLVLAGRRQSDRADVHLLVEISNRIDGHDVERAAKRAELLARCVGDVMPVVAGESIGIRAATLARHRGVWQVLRGRATEPDPPPR